MSNDKRISRMHQALRHRISWVRCAIESVHHRHNTSAILRTADSMGVMDVHLIPGRFTPSKGPSRGAERWLNLHHHSDTTEAVTAIQNAGYDIWVADFSKDPVTPETLPLDRPVCLWFGAELEGVSKTAQDAATGVVTIPMRGFSQSLNVGVASALVMHTVCERARKERGPEALLSEDVRQETWNRWLTREKQMEAGIEFRSHLQLDLK